MTLWRAFLSFVNQLILNKSIIESKSNVPDLIIFPSIPIYCKPKFLSGSNSLLSFSPATALNAKCLTLVIIQTALFEIFLSRCLAVFREH
jgi:hypothetical protein